MIPASELAQIQADLKSAVCDKTCVISRASNTKDAFGNATKGAYSTIETTVAGMQQPNANMLQNYAYRIGSLNAWHVLLPYGANVQEEDHLAIEGQTLEVHVLLDPHSVPGMTPVLAAEIK